VSEGVGVGVGIGVNLAADMYALSKGNLAILSKDYLPSKAILEKAKKIEKDIKKILSYIYYDRKKQTTMATFN
jgi:hypothetical protein